MGQVERSSYGVYTSLAIALHWGIALAILGLLAAGWRMTSALQAQDEVTKRLAYEVIQLHKALGLTVLALSLLRLIWRLLHPAPPLPQSMPAWQKRLSEFSHFCLYGFMIGAPLTGWIMVSTSPEFSSLPTSVFGLFIAPHLPAAALSEAAFGLDTATTASLARDAHHWLAFLGALLLALHVGAALKHHYVDQDHILARMTPGLEPRRPVHERPAPRATGLARGLAGGLALTVVAAGGALALLTPATTPAPQQSAALSAPAPAASEGLNAEVSTAPLWTVAAETSKIGFTGAHLGAPFTGVFGRWRAEIRFDPDDLAASRVRVEIETASGKTGDKQYDGALPEADWFDAANHPLAYFDASTFEPGESTGRYRALGALTIKGKTLPATLPFDLAITGDEAKMTGALVIDRLAFGLGQAADPAAAFVAREVTVNVETVARRQGSAPENP